MIVTLTHDELTVCQLIGRMRSLIARSAGVKDAKVGSHDGAEADVQGIMAEYAFAKHHNVFPDLGLSPRSGSYDGVLNGIRYDIKATKYKSGKLLCTKKHNPDVDIYVLAIVDVGHVEFIGYAKAEELRKEENLTNLGHGEGYALEQHQLRKFKEDA